MQSRRRHACGQIRHRARCQNKQDRSCDHNGRASDWGTIQNSSKKCSDKALGNLFIAVLKLVAVQVAADKCREILFPPAISD